jgi:recyclin-1
VLAFLNPTMMDRFATLEPVKLYATGKTSRPPQNLVGRLPADLHLLVVTNLPIWAIPAYARCSKATAAFVRNDSAWEKRWKALSVYKDIAFREVLDDLENKANERAAKSRAAAPATIAVDDDFVGAFDKVISPIASSTPATPAKDSHKAKFMRAYNLLRPLTYVLSSAPHAVLSDFSKRLSPSLFLQAKLLRLLACFLSSAIQPVPQWESLYASLRTCMDRYDSNLLAAFDVADGKGDEVAMRETAESSWEVWDSTSGDWEMGKVWTEKREIFYQQGKFTALDNFT